MSSNFDEKTLINTVYHSAVVSGLAIGYSQLEKKILGGGTPKLDLTAKDIGMVTLSILSALATKEMLIKQGIIPANISK